MPSSPELPPWPTPARLVEIQSSLFDISRRISAASVQSRPPTLVAVSKHKPASDIAAAYEAGQRDFGENYADELLAKAPTASALPRNVYLPSDIRWHFIGHLQSNKAKALAALPNLHALHTLTSTKLANILDKARASSPPLHVFIQVNTSGEDSKSGLPPLRARQASPGSLPANDGLLALAQHVVTSCPNLRLTGLMTIGSLENSLNASDQNTDFQTLIHTREVLTSYLKLNLPSSPGSANDRSTCEGQEGGLTLSMGMSSDFEAAIRAGSGMVRVGTGIFGERRKKNANAGQTL